MTPPVIELRGLARTYPGPPPMPALRPADLVIVAGDYVAVTGPSGSGKSTLLHLLGLLDVPTEGSYLMDGLDTSALSDRDRSALRGRIGFVFQAFHLLPYRTALEPPEPDEPEEPDDPEDPVDPEPADPEESAEPEPPPMGTITPAGSVVVGVPRSATVPVA